MAAAKDFGCGFAETSAKDGANVEKVFYDIVRGLRRIRNENVQHVGKPNGSRFNSNFRLVRGRESSMDVSR